MEREQGLNQPLVQFPEPVSIRSNPSDYPTEAAERIMEVTLQEWVDRFLEANADYGDTYQSLGAAGQFAEIWRKVPKLKHAMWDGKRLNREQPREILMDLIGHCFLAIHLIDSGNDKFPGETE